MWFAASHGSMGFLALRLAVLLLLVSMMLLKPVRQRYRKCVRAISFSSFHPGDGTHHDLCQPVSHIPQLSVSTIKGYPEHFDLRQTTPTRDSRHSYYV